MAADAPHATDAATQSDWGVYRRLLAYVRPMWWLFLVALIGFAAGNAAEAYFARLFGDIVEALGDPGADDWIAFPLLMLAAVVVRGIGEFAGEYGLAKLSFRVVHRLRTELFDTLLVLPSAFYDRSTRGRLVSRITFNVAQLRDTATDALTTIVQDGSKVLILLGAMLWANAKLTVIFVLVAPVVAAVVSYTSRRFRRISRRIQESMGDVTHVASEVVNGYRVVRTFGGEAYERARFQRASEANQRRNLRLVATKSWSTHVIQVFVAGALAALIALLFQPGIAGTMSAGDVVYFVGLAGLLARPIKKLSEVSARLQRGLAAAEDVFAQLDERAEPDDGRLTIGRAVGRIEFDAVSFDYGIGAGAVLHDVSFVIEPGQRVALVGRSGSGKSTLANLVGRFYEPSAGEIRLDGVPVKTLTLASLRAQISFVAQSTVLFNDTIAHNVAYGCLANATPASIADAIRRAHADAFVASLPDGANTVVGDDGALLSGGQRQRIAIARALLKDAPILILDEATSSLDPESEKHVQAALDEVMRGRTTLVIAHRLSTIENAELILVMDEGRIVERGTHADLLAQGGLYSRLYEARFDDDRAVVASGPERAPRTVAPVAAVRVADPFPLSGWYGRSRWSLLLAPLGAFYGRIAERRRTHYLVSPERVWRAPVPVIVVGNVTVGGTGKTPLVVSLVQHLARSGHRPGIVTRGHGGVANAAPLRVDADTAPDLAGDEPVVLAARTGAPVVACRDRVRAAQHLLATNRCDIVVADDGLQHYRLARDVEIVVLDGERGVGNGRCLPAGPLREPAARIASADLVFATGRATGLDAREGVVVHRGTAFVSVRTGERLPIDVFADTTAHAVAGIGNPNRFFTLLAQLGVRAIAYAYPDHHAYAVEDVVFGDAVPVIVTEKDAVKLRALDPDRLPEALYYLEIEAVVAPVDFVRLDRLLRERGAGTLADASQNRSAT
jgi:subfamily B ATP-binding cassette protein MsbA